MAKKPRKKDKNQTQRAYEGALFNRLNSDWLATGTSADSEVWGSLRSLRNRSRDLCRNNDYARNAKRLIVNNVVGRGIKLQAQVHKKRGELDSKVNQDIEKLWEIWQRPQFCDVAGRLSWSQIQQIAVATWFESGECLFRIVRRAFAGSPVPLAIQVIEPDLLADELTTNTLISPGNEFRLGVEVDQWGRPQFYHLYNYHPGDYSVHINRKEQRVQRVPADQIIHLYATDRPGQTRGVPWLHSAISRLRDIGKYEEAELVKARAQAAIMGFITSPDPGIGEDGDTSPSVSSVEPGQIRKLAPGELFEGFAPTSGGDALEPFLRFMLRAIAAGLGTSYESLSRDYSNTSYSSARTALIEERDTYRVLQDSLAQQLLQPVYERWLNAASLSGALRLGLDYDADPWRYCHCRWQSRGWQWVDPKDEVAAYKEALRAGLITASHVAEQSGFDYEELLEQRAHEIEMAEALGLEFDVNLKPEPAPEMEPEPEAPLEPAIPSGMVPVRGLIQRAKNCKTGKSCGATCISASKACLQGLSPEQKKLAEKARRLMKKGKTGPSVEVPTPAETAQAPPQMAPLPADTVISLGGGPSTADIDAMLQSATTEENAKEMAEFRAFIEKRGTKAVIYGDGPVVAEEFAAAFDELEYDSRFAAPGSVQQGALGYTYQDANHIVVQAIPSVSLAGEIERTKASLAAKANPDSTNDYSVGHPPSTLAVYTHEMGHQVHYSSGLEKWQGATLSQYAETNNNEAFAEGFVAYAFAPQEFKAISPTGYNQIERAIQEAIK